MADSPRVEELRRRVQGDPASIAFAALAEEYRRAGKFREAVDTTRAGLRYHPSYVSARVTLGRSLMELQEYDQAERELAFVIRTAPDNLAARRALGELCWQQLRFADALEHFRIALTLAPNDDELPAIVRSLEHETQAAAAVDEPPEVPEETSRVDSLVARAMAQAEAEADAISVEPVGAFVGDAAALSAPTVGSDAAPARHRGLLLALERFQRGIGVRQQAHQMGASAASGL